MNTINIVHLYPVEMNIYGDNGNLLILKKRLEWRGYKVKVTNVGLGDDIPTDTALIIGGGGQDSGQSKIADDLQIKQDQLRELSNNGVPMLMICGLYQMFGHYFRTKEGLEIPGIGLLDVTTIAGDTRVIGNLQSQTEWGDIVGYENHSGLTYLGKEAVAFGKTLKLQGNNGKDFTEGARQNNVFGSYMHGPMLSKSPIFADYLIAQALKINGDSFNNEHLKVDTFTILAKDQAIKRPR